MTYAEAIEFLRGLQVFGANLGLETPRQLAAHAGNPQDRLRFIHVAGTNGKGSTCAMLEGIYRAAGLRTGLFTSPHLVSFRERIQVNRRLIAEPDVARLVAEIRESLATFPAGRHPTFFEVVTVLALKYFAEQKCELVIWETGLGGRLDATNLVTPLASVITNIAFDHQQWLGDTLVKIAAEKAGIIKPSVPVITAADKPEALQVIQRIARETDAPLVQVEQAGRLFETGGTPVLPLLGEHQRLNAALALAAVAALQSKIPVSAEQIRRGLTQLDWPGRLQLIGRADGRKLLLDGAHNVAGVESLRAALARYFPGVRPAMVLGILGDKDWAPMCEILAPLASRILLVPVNSPRSASTRALAESCRRADPAANVAVCISLPDALARAASDELVVITGSLYLVGEALELTGAEAGRPAGERGLNEWTGGSSHR